MHMLEEDEVGDVLFAGNSCCTHCVLPRRVCWGSEERTPGNGYFRENKRNVDGNQNWKALEEEAEGNEVDSTLLHC